VDGIYLSILVSSIRYITSFKSKGSDRDYADFTIPMPFSTKVQNALKAEPTSVKLSSLVGAGGLWYGFGKMIMSTAT